MKIFVFDTETGGLDSNTCSCLEVGALVGDLDTGEVFETFESKVKLPSRDDYNVTAGAFKVHGITVEECMAEGMTPEDIGTKMIDMFVQHGAQLYGGHNVPFDVRFVARKIFGFEPDEWDSTFTFRKIDTHDIIRLMLGTDNMKSGATLGQIAKTLKIPTGDISGGKYHAALFDALITFRVMLRFREAFKSEQFLPLVVTR
jgi:DNA polymerase-3 subunit epsilon/ribonuclease T